MKSPNKGPRMNWPRTKLQFQGISASHQILCLHHQKEFPQCNQTLFRLSLNIPNTQSCFLNPRCLLEVSRLSASVLPIDLGVKSPNFVGQPYGSASQAALITDHPYAIHKKCENGFNPHNIPMFGFKSLPELVFAKFLLQFHFQPLWAKTHTQREREREIDR